MRALVLEHVLLARVYHCGSTLVKIWYNYGMGTVRKSKHLRFTSEDWELVAALKRYYGITSDNEVIRLALRAAKRELDRSSPTPDKERPL